MANPWIRRISRIAIAVVIIAALAVPWAFPAVTAAVVMKIAKVIPPLSLPLIVLLAAEATLVLVAAIWWLWWRLPKRQVRGLDLQIHDPKARADTEDNFRKTVGQALGGAAVLIGAGAAYLQFSQQQQATEISRKAAQDLLISNQVAKGFEQLAGKDTTMRLGGIYALEGVMNTAPEYHQSVLEALCAFVREGTIGMMVNETPAADIQAALTVIGRRKEGAGRIDLSRAIVPRAELSRAKLSGANLSRVNLHLAFLGGSNLTRADLNSADLSGADLRDADLSGANLNGADLIRANLRDTILSGAILGSTNLSGASLTGANLSRAYMTGTDLSSANLSGASLISTYLIGINLTGANLSGADLFDASMNGANLSGADLFDANLTGARSLTQNQLDKACGKPRALPPGLTLDQPCPPPR